MYGRVRRAGVPVGHLAAAERDLARVGVLAAVDALGVGLAGGHHARRAERRRPLDLARRRPVARVEEARRGALGRLAALEPRPGGGHRVAALLDRRADRLEVARRRRAVDRRRRALVRAERLLVVRLRRLARRPASARRGRARGSRRRARRRPRARRRAPPRSAAAARPAACATRERDEQPDPAHTRIRNANGTKRGHARRRSRASGRAARRRCGR